MMCVRPVSKFSPVAWKSWSSFASLLVLCYNPWWVADPCETVEACVGFFRFPLGTQVKGVSKEQYRY
jgi:hypothetical protein